jgi:aerobic carbon-monoxide dehydrogenase large subunit
MTTEMELQTTPEVGGMGHSVKRKEDPRFIRGHGEYIDDLVLPGMLWLDIVRTPYAHATIKSIDASEALAIPGVLAVITGADLVKAGLPWMPTLAGDKQMVLPTDTVMYQAQEVAAVVATSRYIAADGAAAVMVDYEPLPVIVDPFKALEPDAFVLRPDRGPDKANNLIWHWESGDRAKADAALASAEVGIAEDIYLPRLHVSSIETCGCIADWDPINAHLTLHMTSQAPHVIRTVLALVSGLPEHQIRVKTHDIGGGFGGKVPVYPGYVLAVVASLTTGKPVKWIEDRSENLQADSFARDYHTHAELAATKEGRITGLKVRTVADHGYSDAAADPSKFPAGLFNVITGSYDFPNAFVEVDGVYTNKPPGGVAYRCSFRVTEAVHAIERMVDILAHQIGKDPAQLRMENFIQPEQFPYTTPTGWSYDSGNYGVALQKAMDLISYDELRREQAEKRARGELMGIGICSFTEIVGAGPSHDFDIIGLKMNDGCEIRVSTRPARCWPGSDRRPRARATRRPTPRSSPRSSVSRSRTSRSSTATPIRRHTASAPTVRARRRPLARRPPWLLARSGTRPARSPPTCSRPARTTSSGRTASSASRARQTGPRRSRRSRSLPTRTSLPAWRWVSRRSTTTTRRT